MQEALEQWKQMAWARESGIGEQEFPAGALYIVGLPIGNAADITIRALWTLAIADCVAAEDTRQTQKILSRYGITTHEISVREFNEVTGAQTIIERLKNGERVALVTDAGTPAVSDPGALVVKIVRIPGDSGAGGECRDHSALRFGPHRENVYLCRLCASAGQGPP